MALLLRTSVNEGKEVLVMASESLFRGSRVCLLGVDGLVL